MSRLERISVANVVNGKLVRTLAWKTRSREDADQRAARLAAMARRMK